MGMAACSLSGSRLSTPLFQAGGGDCGLEIDFYSRLHAPHFPACMGRIGPLGPIRPMQAGNAQHESEVAGSNQIQAPLCRRARLQSQHTPRIISVWPLN